LEIIQATDHELWRIEITENLKIINSEIDIIVNNIKAKIFEHESLGTWEPWDLEKEFNPDYYKEKGYLDVSENPKFRKIVDACNCLGQNYIAVQSAWFKSKKYPNHYLWFPKFYENEDWDNKIINDGEKIIQRCKKPEKYNNWYNSTINNPGRRIITFPRSIDNLGFRLYKFAGIFEIDMEKSSHKNGVILNLKEKKLKI